MRHEIVQAGVGAVVDARDSAERLRIEHPVADHSQLAAALAHQNVAVREKGHAKGTIEGLGDDGDFYFVLFGRVEDERTIAQRRPGKIDHVSLPVEKRGRHRGAEKNLSHG